MFVYLLGVLLDPYLIICLTICKRICFVLSCLLNCLLPIELPIELPFAYCLLAWGGGEGVVGWGAKGPRPDPFGSARAWALAARCNYIAVDRADSQ